MTPRQIRALATRFQLELEVTGKISNPDVIWVYGPDDVYGGEPVENLDPPPRQDPYELCHCHYDWGEAEEAILSYIIDIYLDSLGVNEYWSDILLAHVGWPRLEPIVLHHDRVAAAMLYDWAQDTHPDWLDFILLCRKIHLALDT